MGSKSIIVVSSYPRKGEIHSAETVGVASYTKQLLGGVISNSDLRVRVVAERLKGEKAYEEAGVEVSREWKRGSWCSVNKLCWGLFWASEKTIVVSFEAFMFGNLLLGAFFINKLKWLRLRGKQVIIMMHQAPVDVDGKWGWLLRLYYRLIESSVNEIVVFEEELSERFSENKITVVPHLLPAVKIISQKTAKKQLGLDEKKRYLLYFGYIAPYKGVEWLVTNWEADWGYELVVAGGINPNHINNKQVCDYVGSVEKLAKMKEIKVTGFVEEVNVGLYFSACDGVILPYEQFMSSSGPLSLAWAYGKPVLMSSEMRSYLDSEDIREAMKESELRESDVFFGRSKASLEKVIAKLDSRIKYYSVWATKMRYKRDVKSVSEKFLRVIGGTR